MASPYERGGLCPGKQIPAGHAGRVIGPLLAAQLIKIFLGARLTGAKRRERSLAKVDALGHDNV
ncbi:MAG TPA: hypothetical protein VGG64_24560 [Pirellulales bacterium]|jgi:hypothetical protein